MAETVNADPTKEFFVEMITRDISLEDCIFDLVDNSVDGASKDIARGRAPANPARRYQGYRSELRLDRAFFEISDNCGGIGVDEAKKYAFRFGRDSTQRIDAVHGIGLYGIGMKRALFKLGGLARIASSTTQQSFLVEIDVAQWLERKPWDFEMNVGKPVQPGTRIKIENLREGVAEELGNTAFQNRLRRLMARDYSLIVQKGFALRVNEVDVQPFVFTLRVSDEFKPLRVHYGEDGVNVTISAGLAGLPADDFENPEDVRRASDEYWGWFVVCNDRVVLAADKTERTVWGDEGFQEWHPQYNSFMGIVEFSADNPQLLPWTTTKREIDVTSPLYRRAVQRMKEATTAYIAYTNARKADLDAAHASERKTQAVALQEVQPRESMLLMPA